MKRILIIRLSAIGDVVMASGLLPALRSRWPDAHIAWLVEPGAASLLDNNPLVDEVIRLPRPRWRELRKKRHYPTMLVEMRAFARRLRAERFDLALDAQGLLKSGIWAWLSRAPERVGIGSREGSQRLMTRVLEPARDDRRMSSEYRFLAESLGTAPDTFRLSLEVGPDDDALAQETLAEAGVRGPFAVLCPFTTRPQKHWFEDRWAAVIDRLQAELGLHPVILGGPGDRDAAARISAAAGAPVADLAGRLSLAASAAVVTRASLLIGVDTGLTHMGTARRLPTVVLFGSTRPYLETDNPRTEILYEPLFCSPCRRHPICHGEFSCMRLHKVDQVLAAAQRQVEKPA